MGYWNQGLFFNEQDGNLNGEIKTWVEKMMEKNMRDFPKKVVCDSGGFSFPKKGGYNFHKFKMIDRANLKNNKYMTFY